MADPWAVQSVQPSNPWAVTSIDRAPAPKKRSAMDYIGGVAANINAGLGIADEGAAAIATVGRVMGGERLPDAWKNALTAQRGLEDGFTADHPAIGGASKGLGNALTMAAPIGPGAEAFAGGIPLIRGAAIPAGRVANAMRGAALAGATGAGFAAVDRGTPAERLKAASDAVRDPLTLALGAGAGALATIRPKATKPAVPSLSELKVQKKAAYDAVEANGERYSPEAFSGLLNDMATKMDAEGFSAGSHPKAFAKIQGLRDTQAATGGYAPTLPEVDALRQQIWRDVASSKDKGDARMGHIMRDSIDNFITDQGGSPDLLAGRDLHQRVTKLETLNKLGDKAARRAAATGSGGNVENALRQNVDKFIDKENLTPAEREAAMTVVMGTPRGNALRQGGKLSPEGNGLGLTVHTVGAVGSHGATLPVAGVGFFAKKASEAITARNVQALRDLIATGGGAAKEVSRQLADPQYAELRAQLANDLAGQAGVQGTVRRGSVTASVEGHPEYGVGVSSQ